MRFRSLSFAAALALAVAACRGKDAPAPAASASLPEVAAPAGLVAELSLGNPKETWSRLLRAGGGLAQALPSSLPVLLATSLSLPPAAAGTLDESVPFVGAVLSQAGSSEPDLVLGVHVTSGAELIASLTLGDNAKFRRVELAPRVVRLVSAPGAPELDGALGVSGNYLLVASRADALRDAGRFVAEGVAKRARSEPGLTLSTSQGVLGEALSRRLRDVWQSRRGALAERARAEQRAKGRPADFADPEALLAGADGMVESWLAVLESSRALSLNLTPEADRFRAELALTPGAAGAAALSKDVAVGPIAPLLALPQQTTAALLLRGDASGQPGEPSALADSLTRLFGARLNAEQTKKLNSALGNFGQAHHGASVVALVPLPAPSLLLTFETQDAEAFSRSLAEVLALLELPPVSGCLAGVWGKPQLAFSPKPTDGVYRARLRFQRAAAVRSALPPALAVLWQAKDGVGQVLISADEATGFSALAALPRFERAPWFASAQLGQGEHTAAALVADARLLAQAGADDAPLLASFGKNGEQLVVTLDVSTAALPALARVFALDRSP